MDPLSDYLATLVSTSSYELHLKPNVKPYVVSPNGPTDVANAPIQGTQISMLVFPLIPYEVKQELPNTPEVQFNYTHNLGEFKFHVQKSPAGFNVTITPISIAPPNLAEPSAVSAPVVTTEPAHAVVAKNELDSVEQSLAEEPTASAELSSIGQLTQEPEKIEPIDFITDYSDAVPFEQFVQGSPTLVEYEQPVPEAYVSAPLWEANDSNNAAARMESLFKAMAEAGASDLHLSVSMPPMVRKDGKIQELKCGEPVVTPETAGELLTSLMPARNREEFAERNDTDFAYEIPGLARFRCNVFMDRKGMGGVFRIIPAKMTTAEQLGLSSAVLGLCELSKGLVVVTGPTGSGKSTTLCAMVNHINSRREDHVITIEDPIEFVHENIKCLVNQREVHNHTGSFKDALRAALREDPDILLVGEMRDLETISIAIETAETGHLVFGTLHTTTAASTVDRIIDQFPADRQQQVRVMLSESLKGVIAQTLLPKKGGGRVAALEILIITPAISNLIREGKTFQIPSAMQTGKSHGMVMLNDALYNLVEKGIVEPRDAYIKAVDKTGFESMLTRGGFKI